MSLVRRVVRGAGLLTAGQALSQVLVFGRNVIVVRMLTEEEFGIASLFALAMTFFEMVSDLSVQKIVVQDAEAEESTFLHTAQALQALRGAAVALLLVLFAGPLAALFNEPNLVGAFRALAIVPFLRGLTHLDVFLQQRDLVYGPFILTEALSQLVALALAYPLLLWRADHVAVIALLVVQAVAYLVLSHMLARRPFRFRLGRTQALRITRFGWPLLLNGLLMYGVLQGDRVVIGAWYPDKALLGIYSVGYLVTMIPGLMLGRVACAVLLPLLSAVQDDDRAFTGRTLGGQWLLGLVGGAVTIAFALLGAPVVALVYGERYADVASFLGLLAAMQAVRVVRAGNSMSALARGRTEIALAVNVVRILSFVGLVWVAMRHGPLPWIAAAGLAGELLALAASAPLLRLVCPLSPWRYGLVLSGPILVGALALSIGTSVDPSLLPVALAQSAALLALLLGLGFLTYRRLPEEAQLRLHASVALRPRGRVSPMAAADGTD